MVLINIGLAVTGEMYQVSPRLANWAVQRQGVRVLRSEVKHSDTEPTFVAELDRPLTDNEAYWVSVILAQEAVAQSVDGVGELHGPNAVAWRPFDPAKFLTFTEGKEL